MKKMKSMLSLLLAMVMVFAMTITSFADEKGYTITINNTQGGHTYEAYQIFTGDLYEEEGKADVLSNVVWGEGVKSEDLLTALKADTTIGTAFTDATTAADVADVLKENANDAEFVKAFSIVAGNNLGTATKTSAAGSGSYTITVSEPGYYLVKDKANSVVADDSYTAYILQVVSDVEVDAKSDIISVEKKVLEDNPKAYSDTADYDIGDKVPFQITVDLPSNVDDYDEYYLKINDTLSKGLTYDSDTLKVSVDDVELSADQYVTSSVADKDGNTVINVTFTDIKALEASGETIRISNDSKIVVTYEAELNTNAIIGGEGNKNTVSLEYSNNPNNTSIGTSTSDEVTVFTYKLVVSKVGDDKETPLKGAQFTLNKLVDNNWVLVITTDVDDATEFTFTGLDEGTYQLVESTTPAGYNTIDPIEFVIASTTKLDTEDGKFKITSLTGTDQATDNKATFKADTSAGSLATTIVNYSGTVLPSTGGMGTTVIYIVGAVLVLGAFVVLIARRKVNSK